MVDPRWLVGRDALFESQLVVLVRSFPHAERVWTAVRWEAARDPISRSIVAAAGIRARTTRGMWGVPPLVWFFIADGERLEVEFVGVIESLSDDDSE